MQATSDENRYTDDELIPIRGWSGEHLNKLDSGLVQGT